MADEPTISQEPTDDSERRRRFEAVLGAYFEALDAGQSPDRQELLARHPDLASELAEFFTEQDRFHRLVAPLRPESTEPGGSPIGPPRGPPDPHSGDPGRAARLPPEPGATADPAETGAHPEAATLPRGGSTDHATGSRDGSASARADGDPDDLSRGTKVRYFGDYAVLEPLGRGGMGIVYRARQRSLSRLVALKMIRAGRFASADELRRFHNEAEAVATLDHPNIVPIFEVGQHRRYHYFSMKLIAGGSLADRLADYAADPRAAAKLVASTARAVHHAHQRGVLHRDLKPANILVDDRGQPHVTDFGLARRLEVDSSLTQSGAVVGTPSYMAPEQTTGRRGAVTTATDVYGIGAVLYATLTGRAPFLADSMADTIQHVRERAPEPPSRVNPRVGRDLEVICLKCLEKEPRRRYSLAEAVADDLDRWLRGEPIVARPGGRLEQAVMWARRRPAIAALSALVVLVSLIGLGGILFQWRQAVVARRLAVENADAEARARAEQSRLADQLRAQSIALERQSYTLGIALAQREWEIANLGRVRSLLAQAPAGLRGWEWGYLDRLCKVDLRAIPAADLFDFSPDGTRLVGLDEKRALRIWNLADGRSLAVAGTPDVTHAVWSPRGDRLLVFGHTDNAIREVDPDTGESRSLGGAHPEKLGPWDVDWNTDRTFLVSTHSVGSGSNVRIFKPGSARPERSLDGHALQVHAVAWSPDGAQIATGSEDQTARIWDAASGASKMVLTGHRRQINDVAWSPDGSRLATAGYDATIRLWDPRTGRELHLLEGHTGEVQAIAFAPDGHRLASASWDRTLRLWDVATGAVIAVMRGHEDRVKRVAWSPDGTRLATHGDDGMIRLWDATLPGGPTVLAGPPETLRAVAWSPDGSRLATAGDDHRARIWDADSGRIVRPLEGHEGPIYAAAWSHDGRRLATTDLEGVAMVWDAASGRVLTRFRGHHPQQVYCVAWSPDDTRVVTAGSDGLFKLWDPVTGKELLSLRGMTQPNGYVSGLSWSPDGTRLALALAAPDDSVRVFDLGRGEAILNLKGHGRDVSAVAWSPDGTELASVSYGKTARIWDALAGTSKTQLVGHASFVYAVAWSPDGRRLATAGQDRTVKVWEPRTGTELLSLEGHTGAVWSLSWSPDGTRLASAGGDGRVRIWTGPAPAIR